MILSRAKDGLEGIGQTAGDTRAIREAVMCGDGHTVVRYHMFGGVRRIVFGALGEYTLADVSWDFVWALDELGAALSASAWNDGGVVNVAIYTPVRTCGRCGRIGDRRRVRSGLDGTLMCVPCNFRAYRIHDQYIEAEALKRAINQVNRAIKDAKRQAGEDDRRTAGVSG